MINQELWGYKNMLQFNFAATFNSRDLYCDRAVYSMTKFTDSTVKTINLRQFNYFRTQINCLQYMSADDKFV